MGAKEEERGGETFLFLTFAGCFVRRSWHFSRFRQHARSLSPAVARWRKARGPFWLAAKEGRFQSATPRKSAFSLPHPPPLLTLDALGAA